jgi:hypothetical protein
MVYLGKIFASNAVCGFADGTFGGRNRHTADRHSERSLHIAASMLLAHRIYRFALTLVQDFFAAQYDFAGLCSTGKPYTVTDPSNNNTYFYNCK